MKMWGLLLAAGTLLAPLSGARADPQLNVDYFDFEGRAFIENNPVPVAWVGINSRANFL